jgi:hypothetical protein
LKQHEQPNRARLGTDGQTHPDFPAAPAHRMALKAC